MKAYGKDSGGIWRIIEDNLRTLTTMKDLGKGTDVNGTLCHKFYSLVRNYSKAFLDETSVDQEFGSKFFEKGLYGKFPQKAKISKIT